MAKSPKVIESTSEEAAPEAAPEEFISESTKAEMALGAALLKQYQEQVASE